MVNKQNQNIISRLWKWLGIDRESRELRIANVQADIQIRLKADADKNIKILSDATVKLQSTYCPIIGGNCNSNCTHYKDGHITSSIYHEDIDFVISSVEPPRCKLWK